MQPEDLCLILGTYRKVEGENSLHKDDLCLPYRYPCTVLPKAGRILWRIRRDETMEGKWYSPQKFPQEGCRASSVGKVSVSSEDEWL